MSGHISGWMLAGIGSLLIWSLMLVRDVAKSVMRVHGADAPVEIRRVIVVNLVTALVTVITVIATATICGFRNELYSIGYCVIVCVQFLILDSHTKSVELLLDRGRKPE